MRLHCSRAALLCILLPAGTLGAQSPLAITKPASGNGDLASVRVMDTARALVFRVYYDSVSRPAALSALPALADMYAELSRITGASSGRVEWAAVAFVADTAYTPPRVGPDSVAEVGPPTGCQLAFGAAP